VTAWADAEGLVISLTADARFGPTDLPRLMKNSRQTPYFSAGKDSDRPF